MSAYSVHFCEPKGPVSYFYGVAGDWVYYVEPSPDWVEGYSLRAFVVYRKHLFTGVRQILADGEAQSEAERVLYESMRRVRGSLLQISEASHLR